VADAFGEIASLKQKCSSEAGRTAEHMAQLLAMQEKHTREIEALRSDLNDVMAANARVSGAGSSSVPGVVEIPGKVLEAGCTGLPCPPHSTLPRHRGPREPLGWSSPTALLNPDVSNMPYEPRHEDYQAVMADLNYGFVGYQDFGFACQEDYNQYLEMYGFQGLRLKLQCQEDARRALGAEVEGPCNAPLEGSGAEVLSNGSSSEPPALLSDNSNTPDYNPPHLRPRFWVACTDCGKESNARPVSADDQQDHDGHEVPAEGAATSNEVPPNEGLSSSGSTVLSINTRSEGGVLK